MPHRSTRLVLALCAVMGTFPATAGAHYGDHPSLTWILEESCVGGGSWHADDADWAGGGELRDLPFARPRLAGRFRSAAPRRVTVLVRSGNATASVRAPVRRAGRFAADLRSMPDRIGLRWRGDNGALHATRWSGRLHSGCEDAGPERPPGIPSDWIPSYPAECGDDGPACPPPTWAPDPRGA